MLRRALVVASLTCACMVARAADGLAALDAAFAQCIEAAAGYAPTADDVSCSAPASIASLCPGLVEAVVASDLVALLPADWHDALSQERLADLRHFAATLDRVPEGRELATGGIRRILDDLRTEQPPEQRLSLWGRFKEWVRAWFERSRQPQPRRFDFDIPERVQQLVAYGLLAGIVIALIALVVHELRVAGAMSGPGRPRRPRGDATATAADRAPGLADVAQAPLHEQPSLVLRLLVDGLTGARRLADRRSLTHRELERAARLDTAEDRRAFHALLRTAEAARYGNRPPGEEEVAAAVHAGLLLVERVAALPPVTA